MTFRRKRAELKKLEKEMTDPDFWNNQEKAQKIVQKRSRIERSLESQEKFETAVSDAEVLFEFAETDKASDKGINRTHRNT